MAAGSEGKLVKLLILGSGGTEETGRVWSTGCWVKVPSLEEDTLSARAQDGISGSLCRKGGHGTGEGLPARGQEPWF